MQTALENSVVERSLRSRPQSVWSVFSCECISFQDTVTLIKLRPDSSGAAEPLLYLPKNHGENYTHIVPREQRGEMYCACILVKYNAEECCKIMQVTTCRRTPDGSEQNPSVGAHFLFNGDVICFKLHVIT